MMALGEGDQEEAQDFASGLLISCPPNPRWASNDPMPRHLWFKYVRTAVFNPVSLFR